MRTVYGTRGGTYSAYSRASSDTATTTVVTLYDIVAELPISGLQQYITRVNPVLD